MNKKIPPLHSLTWLWFSLFAYSVLFGLLQKLMSSVPGLPEGIVLLLSCAVASAIPLLWSSLVSGEAPHFSSQKASLGTLVFLISVALSGNLAVMVLTPVLERVWNLVGFTAQAAAVGEEIATPLLAIYICIVGPVLEELIYRGVVLRRLLPGGARQAILLSALCFGLMHHDLYQGLSAFWCGLIFGYAALHYGLGTSIGLHIAGNSIAEALPLLRQAGTPGALAILALVFVPVVIAATGGIRLLLKRRGRKRERSQAGGSSGVWSNPALWMLLAFDTVYLVVASFTHR